MNTRRQLIRSRPVASFGNPYHDNFLSRYVTARIHRKLDRVEGPTYGHWQEYTTPLYDSTLWQMLLDAERARYQRKKEPRQGQFNDIDNRFPRV